MQLTAVQVSLHNLIPLFSKKLNTETQALVGDRNRDAKEAEAEGESLKKREVQVCGPIVNCMGQRRRSQFGDQRNRKAYPNAVVAAGSKRQHAFEKRRTC